jgi:hypothetical protein
MEKVILVTKRDQINFSVPSLKEFEAMVFKTLTETMEHYNKTGNFTKKNEEGQQVIVLGKRGFYWSDFLDCVENVKKHRTFSISKQVSIKPVDLEKFIPKPQNEAQTEEQLFIHKSKGRSLYYANKEKLAQDICEYINSWSENVDLYPSRLQEWTKRRAEAEYDRKLQPFLSDNPKPTFPNSTEFEVNGLKLNINDFLSYQRRDDPYYIPTVRQNSAQMYVLNLYKELQEKQRNSRVTPQEVMANFLTVDEYWKHECRPTEITSLEKV